MRSQLAVAVGVGLVVLIATFGAMTTFWYVAPQSHPIPGHWDYASGTIGDALVLPTLASALTYLFRMLPPTSREGVAGTAGGVVGMLGGASVQYSWLADANPRLNWVVPHAGQFSAAGWYHAVVLVMLSAAIGALYGTVLIRMRSAPVQPLRATRWAISAFVGAVTVFLFLVILDSAPSANTSSSTITILVCACGITVATVPLTAAAGRGSRLLVLPLFIGIAAGAALDLVLLALWPDL